MKSLKLTITITGKRLEYLKILSRTLDDEKRLTTTAKKLANMAIDKAGKGVEACIAEAKGENDDNL